MKQIPMIMAAERNAAKLLDMTPKEFRKLVDAGHLPPPVRIAEGIERWPVDRLAKIGSGEDARAGIDEDVSI